MNVDYTDVETQEISAQDLIILIPNSAEGSKNLLNSVEESDIVQDSAEESDSLQNPAEEDDHEEDEEAEQAPEESEEEEMNYNVQVVAATVYMGIFPQ